MLSRIRAVYREYPRQFWLLIAIAFIDMLGGALIFPFLTLYVTKRFEVGMTEVGLLFGLFSLAAMVGGGFGGALADRWGRKGVIIFGLVTSALSGLVLGFVNSFALFFGGVLFMRLFSNSAVAMWRHVLTREATKHGPRRWPPGPRGATGGPGPCT